MLQWQGIPPRTGGRRGDGGGQRGRGQDNPGTREAADQRQDASEPVTYNMTFSDHRAVSGMKVPYVITRAVNGQTVERWTIRSYRINPSFNAETFTR
jgi:hypothetical protein